MAFGVVIDIGDKGRGAGGTANFDVDLLEEAGFVVGGDELAIVGSGDFGDAAEGVIFAALGEGLTLE